MSPSASSAPSVQPCADPDAASLRSTSPTDTCTKPNSRERRAHWVPFPEPGPPRTNTMCCHALPRVLQASICGCLQCDAVSTLASGSGTGNQHSRQDIIRYLECAEPALGIPNGSAISILTIQQLL